MAAGFSGATGPGPSLLGFNARASLPTRQHLNQMLRQMPNAVLQFLLADSVRLIRDELQARQAPPIDCVSLDTKHILAWVKENNPKAYVPDRYNKAKQPAGRSRLSARLQAPPQSRRATRHAHA